MPHTGDTLKEIDMPKLTFKEHRGDRFLGFIAQIDGKVTGHGVTISWIASNNGDLFARNHGKGRVNVRVVKPAGVGPDGRLLPDVVLFEGVAGEARYQRDAYKIGRAYLREIDARGMIERDLTSGS
jgi:hypothetical protein